MKSKSPPNLRLPPGQRVPSSPPSTTLPPPHAQIHRSTCRKASPEHASEPALSTCGELAEYRTRPRGLPPTHPGTDSSKYRAHPIYIGGVLFCVVTMPFGIGGQIPRLNAKVSKRVILKRCNTNSPIPSSIPISKRGVILL
jgi:hypothetical protein